MAENARDHDIVVLGASGFVGALVADHVARHSPAGTRIAIAGRSRGRLERVRAALPAPAFAWPVVVADTGDDPSLRRLAASARIAQVRSGTSGSWHGHAAA